MPLSHWMPGSAVGPGGAVGPNSPPERVETLQKTLLRVLACLSRALQQLVVRRRHVFCDASVVDGESPVAFALLPRQACISMANRTHLVKEFHLFHGRLAAALPVGRNGAAQSTGGGARCRRGKVIATLTQVHR